MNAKFFFIKKPFLNPAAMGRRGFTFSDAGPDTHVIDHRVSCPRSSASNFRFISEHLAVILTVLIATPFLSTGYTGSKLSGAALMPDFLALNYFYT